MVEQGTIDPGVAAPIEAPTPAPQVPEGRTYDPETHITVPKAHLADYDGRFGDALRDAKAYADAKAGGRFDPGMDKIMDLARQNNMTPEQVYEYITSEGQGQGQQQLYDVPGQQPAGQQPPTALTEDRYNQLRQAERAEDATARQTEQETTQRAQAFDTESEDVTRMLRDEFKYTFSEDGLPAGSKATVAQQLFHSALNQVMKDDIPNWLSREERAEALRTIGSTPSTSAQRQKAKESFTQLVTDFKNDAVAEFATGQAGVPAATLGTGAGGAVTKDVKDMTHAEEEAELDRRVYARTGRHIDEKFNG